MAAGFIKNCSVDRPTREFTTAYGSHKVSTGAQRVTLEIAMTDCDPEFMEAMSDFATRQVYLSFEPPTPKPLMTVALPCDVSCDVPKATEPVW